MREFAPRLPAAGTIYDYCIDAEKLEWQPWEARLPSASRQAALRLITHADLRRKSLQTNRCSFDALRGFVGTCRGMQQTPQHRIAVPTIGMQRTLHVAAALVAAGSHVLLAGPAGVLRSSNAGDLFVAKA